MLEEPDSQTISPQRAAAELVLAILTLLGAGFVVLIAVVWRTLDCSDESYSTCSPGAQPQLLLAVLGLLPALAMIVDCFRPQGKPMRWFFVTIAIYVFWLALARNLG